MKEKIQKEINIDKANYDYMDSISLDEWGKK